MRKVKRWRYYCDFCKKVGGSGYHMKNHERACTKNPDRVCGMCRKADLDQKPIDKLIEVCKPIYLKSLALDMWEDFEEKKNVETEFLETLSSETEGCPACMLATIIQGEFHEIDFSFKAERDLFWSAVNTEAAEEMGPY